MDSFVNSSPGCLEPSTMTANPIRGMLRKIPLVNSDSTKVHCFHTVSWSLVSQVNKKNASWYPWSAYLKVVKSTM